MNSLEDVFAAWETMVDFANDMSVPVPTAYGWRRRNSLPVKYWPVVIAAAKRRNIKGITLELLASLSTRAA